MLDVFRQNTKKLAWTLWLVIAAFVIFLIPGGVRQISQDRQEAAATVGPYEVTFADYQNAFRRLEEQYRDSFGQAYTPELARQLGLQRQALESLVRDKILLAEAERMGIDPTNDEVQKAILAYPIFKDDQGHFVGAQQYLEILKRNRIDPAAFESDVRESLKLTRLTEVLSDTVYVSEAEVERAAREQAERAQIRYLKLQGSDLGAVDVTDDELAAYYAEHAADYRLPERRRIAYLSVNANQIRAQLDVPDTEVRAYYDASPEQFTRQEQVRARHILLFGDGERTPEQARLMLEDLRRRIEAGEDFAALATAVSEDEGSKVRGGDLGFFPRGEMTPAFEEAVFSAPEGALVGPFENTLGTRTGFHLVQVLNKRPGGLEPFEQASNRIRVQLLNERARTASETRARDLYEQLKGQEQVDEAALRSVAEREGMAVEAPEPFGLSDNVPGLGPGSELARAVFELGPGSYGEPARIPAGWAIPVVLEVLEPRMSELAEVKDRVRQDLLARRQNELAAERLRAVRAEIEAGTKGLDQAAAELGVTVAESAEFGQRGTIQGLGPAPEVVAAALALDEGQLGGPYRISDGAVLFAVTARQRFDPVAFAQNQEQTRDQLKSERVNSLLLSLIEQRRVEMKVSYSRKLLETLELDAEQLSG